MIDPLLEFVVKPATLLLLSMVKLSLTLFAAPVPVKLAACRLVQVPAAGATTTAPQASSPLPVVRKSPLTVTW